MSRVIEDCFLPPRYAASRLMMPTRQGAFRLFRLVGIDVFLHWSWFLVAVYQISYRQRDYSSPLWNVLEYLALFLIVLTHEFGHSLACRQVGGQADQIVLWPLGGVAYVSPPQRPGATLWSIAAGPLVNVVLVPILLGIVLLGGNLGWNETMPDIYKFFRMLGYINFAILFFNMLPIYPLDGGQILRSLLWFVLGRARSLFVASIVGFFGVAALIGLAVFLQSPWIGVMAVFILLNCWRGLMQARALAHMEALPRRSGFACPVCKAAPPMGDFWLCGKCRKPFDTFATYANCPNCHGQFDVTMCVECRNASPIGQWVLPPPIPPGA